MRPLLGTSLLETNAIMMPACHLTINIQDTPTVNVQLVFHVTFGFLSLRILNNILINNVIYVFHDTA